MLSTTVPGPQVGWTDLIDSCLDNDEPMFDMFPLRPSNAGKCSRAMAFELWEYLGKGTFPKEKKEPHVKRLLSLGSSVEYHSIRNFDLITKTCKDFRVTYKQQVLVAFRLNPATEADHPPLVKGSLDFAVENKKEGWCIFFDCKSAKDKFSSYASSKWDETLEKLSNMKSAVAMSETAFWVDDLEPFLQDLDDPFFVDNFLQTNVYCCTDFAKEVNCIAGAVYKYNKNTSQHMEVRFRPCPNLAREFQDKCNAVYELAKTGSLDRITDRACDFHVGSMKHAFCACHIYSGEGQDGARKAYFKTFPAKQWPDDLHKLKNKAALEGMFGDFFGSQEQADAAEGYEQEIIRLLGEENCQKVKLPNGHIYEVKHYKTGGAGNGPRLALKRAKL